MNRIFDFSDSEVITFEKFFSRIHPEDQNKVNEALERAYKGLESYNIEYRLVLPNSNVKYIWSRAKVHFELEDAVRLVGTVLDLTEEKVAEQELKAVQTELSEIKEFVFLAESVPQLVWTTARDGKVEYFNEKFYQYTGKTREEMIEWGWTKIIHQEDLDRTIEVWTRAVQSKSLYQIEYRLRKFDGEYRWFLGKGTPMKDDSGMVVKWFGTCTDIDDMKRSEEELIKKNRELTKTNRDLDSFVYTASHDLKAPVANLEGLITVHKKKVGSRLTDEERKVLDLMETSINRFKNTIHDLTEISKIGKSFEGEAELVFFSETIEDVKADLSIQIEESNARIKTSFNVPDIYFSNKNLKSVIYNLISNSIKYRSEKRPLLVEIKTDKEDNMTVVSVKDNGIGFDITKKETAFSMFRRLHNHVEGTGLGLYIVKRIIEDAGGEIHVESRINEGTEFKLYLP